MLRKLAHYIEKNKAGSLPYTVSRVDPGWMESPNMKSKTRILIGENIGPRGKDGLLHNDLRRTKH